MVTSSLKMTSQLIQSLASFCGLAYRLGWVKFKQGWARLRTRTRRDEKKKVAATWNLQEPGSWRFHVSCISFLPIRRPLFLTLIALLEWNLQDERCLELYKESKLDENSKKIVGTSVEPSGTPIFFPSFLPSFIASFIPSFPPSFLPSFLPSFHWLPAHCARGSSFSGQRW